MKNSFLQNKKHNNLIFTTLKSRNPQTAGRPNIAWNKPMLASHCSVFTGVYNNFLKKDIISWDNFMYIGKHNLNSRNAGEYT